MGAAQSWITQSPVLKAGFHSTMQTSVDIPDPNRLSFWSPKDFVRLHGLMISQDCPHATHFLGSEHYGAA